MVLEGPEGVWVGPAERRLEGAVLRATAALATGEPGGWLARDAFDVTLIGEGWAASLPGCAAGEG